MDNRPFKDWTTFNHSNTKLVLNLDPHCINFLPVACSKRHLTVTITINGIYFSNAFIMPDSSGFWLTVWFHMDEAWPVIPKSSSPLAPSAGFGAAPLLVGRSFSRGASVSELTFAPSSELDSASRGDC